MTLYASSKDPSASLALCDSGSSCEHCDSQANPLLVKGTIHDFDPYSSPMAWNSLERYSNLRSSNIFLQQQQLQQQQKKSHYQQQLHHNQLYLSSYHQQLLRQHQQKQQQLKFKQPHYQRNHYHNQYFPENYHSAQANQPKLSDDCLQDFVKNPNLLLSLLLASKDLELKKRIEGAELTPETTSYNYGVGEQNIEQRHKQNGDYNISPVDGNFSSYMRGEKVEPKPSFWLDYLKNRYNQAVLSSTASYSSLSTTSSSSLYQQLLRSQHHSSLTASSAVFALQSSLLLHENGSAMSKEAAASQTSAVAAQQIQAAALENLHSRFFNSEQNTKQHYMKHLAQKELFNYSSRENNVSSADAVTGFSVANNQLASLTVSSHILPFMSSLTCEAPAVSAANTRTDPGTAAPLSSSFLEQQSLHNSHSKNNSTMNHAQMAHSSNSDLTKSLDSLNLINNQQFGSMTSTVATTNQFAFSECSIEDRLPRSSGNDIRKKIINVWAENLESEFKKIRDVVEQYHYVAIDTEFPGVVAIAKRTRSDYQYRTVKCNVDLLNIIQLGITFANEKREFPDEGSTWQFNFKFDLEHDLYAENAIQLLKEHGIDFHTHQSRGIDIQAFGELIISSGLVMCKNIKWISYHGCYDFGYLLKVLTCAPLPETEETFFELLHDYFPSFCDVKCLLKVCPEVSHNRSLEKTASHLKIDRIGEQHQAGSDSLVTCQIFLKLKELYFNHCSDRSLFSGILYGLRCGHRLQVF